MRKRGENELLVDDCETVRFGMMEALVLVTEEQQSLGHKEDKWKIINRKKSLAGTSFRSLLIKMKEKSMQ